MLLSLALSWLSVAHAVVRDLLSVPTRPVVALGFVGIAPQTAAAFAKVSVCVSLSLFGNVLLLLVLS